MGILFLILKIIGILLAVLVLLATAVVAVPVRYRASLKAQGIIEGNAVFCWMFHAVDLQLWYGEEGISWKFRILGIPVLRQKKKGKEPTSLKSVEEKADRPLMEQEKKSQDGDSPHVSEGLEASKEQAKKRVVESIRKQQAEIVAYQREQDGSAQLSEPGQEGNEVQEVQEVQKMQGAKREEKQQDNFSEQKIDGIPPKGRPSESAGQKHNKEKMHGFKRICNFFSKIPKRFQKLQSIVTGGKPKFTALKARFLNIKKLLLDETNQKAFLHVLQELKILLRHFSPRKASGDIAFSAGGPAHTGEALGILSLFPFWAKYQIAVMPDFMEESFYIRGKIFFKGYIRIWHLLPSGIRLIKDKNIHRLIAAMRR